MDRGAWWAAVHGVAKSRTRLSDFTFTFHFDALEKEMATHSSVLAWRIPGTGSLVGCRLWGRTDRTRLKQLSSSSSNRIWRRKWQPNPVFLPGESHGRRSLVGYSPWGRKESDTTERLHFHFLYFSVQILYSLSSVTTRYCLIWTMSPNIAKCSFGAKSPGD